MCSAEKFPQDAVKGNGGCEDGEGLGVNLWLGEL